MSERQVGIVKRNAATEVADQLKEMNARRGAPAGRMSGAPIEAISGPRVRSAEMNAGPSYLTVAEQEALDDKAREIGILPPKEDTEEPVGVLGRTKDEILSVQRMTAREFVDAHPPLTYKYPTLREQGEEIMSVMPRLPNFTNIQGIDLIRNVAYVDSFEVELPIEFVKELKGVILQLSVDLVTKKLAEAMLQLNPPKESEESNAVQESQGQKEVG